jgi:hypothetical protein
MPFNFIQSIVDLVTPKAIQRKKSMNELVDMGSIIEARNECDEIRYIEVERSHYTERQKDLEVLLTKCKRLLSFVERTNHEPTFMKMVNFIGKVRQAKYRGDTILPLLEEFDKIEKIAKKGSRSFNNLSGITMLG